MSGADVETVRARLVKVRDEIVGLTRGMPADVALDYLGGIDDDIAKLDALVGRVAEAEKALREIVDLPHARPTGYDSDGAMGAAPVSISEAQAIALAALSHSPEAVQDGDDAA